MDRRKKNDHTTPIYNLQDYDTEDLINGLEGQFEVLQDLNTATEELKKHIGKFLSYESCCNIKRFYEFRLKLQVNKGNITSFGVSFLAIGIFNVWFTNNTWQNSHEYITVKIY